MGLLDILTKVGGVVAAPFTGGASLTPMLIGAGLGAAKHFGIDKPAAERSRKTAAEIQRYSPWTGMKAPEIKDASLLSSTLGGAALGATAGSAIDKLAEKGIEKGVEGAATLGSEQVAKDAAAIADMGKNASNMSQVAMGAVPASGMDVGKTFGGMALDSSRAISPLEQGIGQMAATQIPSASAIGAPALGSSVAANSAPSLMPKLGEAGKMISGMVKGPGRYQTQGPDQAGEKRGYKRKQPQASAWMGQRYSGQV